MSPRLPSLFGHFAPKGYDAVMERRDFLAALGCAAITGALTAQAQPAMPVVGTLNSGPAEAAPGSI